MFWERSEHELDGERFCDIIGAKFPIFGKNIYPPEFSGDLQTLAYSVAVALNGVIKLGPVESKANGLRR